MQTRLSDSVKIRYLEANTVMEELRRAARRLKASNVNVRRAVLFGSLVEGTYGPGSDADVLVVLDKDDRRKIDRIPEFSFAFSEVSIPVDVFPLTEQEIERELRDENFFLKRALKEGVDLAPVRRDSEIQIGE